MSFVDGFVVIQGGILEILLLIQAKENGNIFKEVSLVLLDTQNVVRIGFADGFGNRGLRSLSGPRFGQVKYNKFTPIVIRVNFL